MAESVPENLLSFPGSAAAGAEHRCSFRDLAYELWEEVKVLMEGFEDPKRFDYDFNRKCQNLIGEYPGREQDCLNAIAAVRNWVRICLVRGTAETLKDEDAAKDGKENGDS